MSYVCAFDDLRDPMGLMMGVSRGGAAIEGSSSGDGDDLMQAFTWRRCSVRRKKLPAKKFSKSWEIKAFDRSFLRT